MANVYLVEIDQQPIELYKLLKIADLVSGGGEAKVLIAQGYVLLNNEVEFQKRKKVYDGDYIQLGDNIIEVQYVAPAHDEQTTDYPAEEINSEHSLTEQLLTEQQLTEKLIVEQQSAPKPRQSSAQSKNNKKSGQPTQKAAKSSSKSSPKPSAKTSPKHKSGSRQKVNESTKNSGKRRAISF